MTTREFYQTIVEKDFAPELTEFAKAAIDKMDKANEVRRNKPSKAALENAPLVERILTEILSAEPKTATDVAAILEVSTQKASALLRSCALAGKANVQDMKITGKGTVKGYTLAE